MTAKELSRLCAGKSITEIKKLICGKKLGYGVHRTVYILKQDPDYVVKIERDFRKGMFANVTEWRNYMDNLHWHWFAKWLAPCVMIDEPGRILIQKRVVQDKRPYPKKIPALFTDLKKCNFGWIGDQFVCCDYSSLLTVIKSKTNKPMRYAKW